MFIQDISNSPKLEISECPSGGKYLNNCPLKQIIHHYIHTMEYSTMKINTIIYTYNNLDGFLGHYFW